ncbi:type VI secretion system protein TssA [Hafnia alvei]|uniref:type VI secretion system protein TssA n=1 Tax=Hafnia alvei TaxID=569 RepID=UPI001033F7CD|nr:type VI secretion system protein TssA [Hafnia alvei]TBM17943.1 type VI secretion system protein TssA [Hafnia alvei]
MAMDLHDPAVWISHLLENLPEDKLASALNDDDEEWEYIDGEIVKLGSLTHSQLDIPELQRRGLAILASESKDFRLLTHLLRTLQHTGDPLLALRLLALFVEHYWTIAAPQNMAHKKRFAAQVMKRFEAGISGFAENAGTEQRDELPKALGRLAQCWLAHNVQELVKATDDLLALYQQAFNCVAPSSSPTPANAGILQKTDATAGRDVSQNTLSPEIPVPQVTVDSHDETAWRDTLQKVATILCERQPDSPQGYRLRRHALWLTITSTPQVESDGRTPLAAVSADMVADYQARLTGANMVLWNQVEKSILLAPYWLDGHYLSAQTALRLGYKQVAEAIRDELSCFLTRLPALTGLLFNDRTPFISEQTKQWLTVSSSGSQVVSPLQSGEELQAVRTCLKEQGLEAALRHLDSLPEGDPRDQFHRQYFGAQLMEESGMEKLAQQQYRILFRTGSQIGLADWEPSLLEQLEQKFTAAQ